MRNRSCGAVALLVAFAIPLVASAQAYPDKPIRVIVPVPAGGTPDVVARMVSPGLASLLGQQLVIDNRGGAGGLIGGEMAAKAVPDGYTLFFSSPGSLTILPHLQKHVNYDTLRDFAPISLVSVGPFLLITHPSVPAKTVKELLALAKAEPGKLNYASAGNGAANHLAMELFKSMAGVNLVHIPYRGPAEALNALVMNEAQVEIQSMLSATPFVQGGRLRLLATTGSKRLAEYPDVPTVAEAAVPGYAVYTWFGVVAPAGVPPPVLARLHAALVQALTSPEMRRQFTNQGAEVVANTPAEFSAFLREEVAKWNKVIRDSGARVD